MTDSFFPPYGRREERRKEIYPFRHINARMVEVKRAYRGASEKNDWEGRSARKLRLHVIKPKGRLECHAKINRKSRTEERTKENKEKIDSTISRPILVTVAGFQLSVALCSVAGSPIPKRPEPTSIVENSSVFTNGSSIGHSRDTNCKFGENRGRRIRRHESSSSTQTIRSRIKVKLFTLSSGS